MDSTVAQVDTLSLELRLIRILTTLTLQAEESDQDRLAKDIIQLPGMEDTTRRNAIVKRLRISRANISFHASIRLHVEEIVHWSCGTKQGCKELHDALSYHYADYLNDMDPDVAWYAVMVTGNITNITKNLLEDLRKSIERSSKGDIKLETVLLGNAGSKNAKFRNVMMVLSCPELSLQDLKSSSSPLPAGIILDEVRNLYIEEKLLVSILAAISTADMEVWKNTGGQWIPAILSRPRRHIGRGIRKGVKKFSFEVRKRYRAIITILRSISGRTKTMAPLGNNQAFQFLGVSFIWIIFAVAATIAVILIFTNRSPQTVPSPSPVLVVTPIPAKDIAKITSATVAWLPAARKMIVSFQVSPHADAKTRYFNYELKIVRNSDNAVLWEVKKMASSSSPVNVSIGEESFHPLKYYIIEMDNEPVEISSYNLFNLKADKKIVVNGQVYTIPSEVFQRTNSMQTINQRGKVIRVRSRELYSKHYSIKLIIDEKGNESIVHSDFRTTKGFFDYGL